MKKSYVWVFLVYALTSVQARALTIHLNVDYDNQSSLPSAEVQQSLKSGSIFTPDILQATKDVEESAGVEIQFPYQLLLQVGDVYASRLALSQPSPKWLQWSYPSSVSHPIAGKRGNHKIVLILPVEKIEAAKLKNALIWVTWRALFYEQVSAQLPSLSLYNPPITISISSGDTNEDEQEIANLKERIPARLMEGAETLFAFAAMRLVSDPATQAQIDQHMRGLELEASYKGLVSLGQSTSNVTEGLAAMTELLKQSLERAFQFTKRNTRTYSSLAEAERDLIGKPLRRTMLTSIAVNLRARHGLRSCRDLLLR